MDDSRTWTHFWPRSAILRERVIECVGAGQEFDKPAGPGDRILPTHQLLYLSRGEGVVTDPRSGERWSIAAPAVAWQFPGVAHGYGPTPGDWDEHWILFTGPASVLVEELGLGAPDRPVAQLSRPSETVLDLFAELRRTQRIPGRRSPFRAATITLEIILELASAIGSPGGDVDLLDRFLAGWRETASVAERARRLGVSVHTLRRITSAETGLAPADLVTEVRLARARSLLLETRLGISEVAREVGFDDPAYFSRQFSRRVGVAPSGFRSRHGGAGRG